MFGKFWSSHFPRSWQQVESRFAEAGWQFTVAVDGDAKVVGVAVVQPAHDVDLGPQPEGIWGELLFLAVSKRARGGGLGTQLLEAAEERYAAAGYLGLMASLETELVEWYSARGWTALPQGAALAFADLKRALAAAPAVAAAGLPTRYAWITVAGASHPVWAWKSLDVKRPITAWPMTSDPRTQDPAQTTEALLRQHSYGLGALPDEVAEWARVLRRQVPAPAGQ